RPDVVCLVARRIHGRATRDQTSHGLPGRHANAGRKLADDFSIDPRWLAGELETTDADQLRRQFLGHARLGEARAEKALILRLARDVTPISSLSRLGSQVHYLAMDARSQCTTPRSSTRCGCSTTRSRRRTA